MNELKFCPLTFIGGSPYQFCLREKCAWWEEFTEHCGEITPGWLQGRKAVTGVTIGGSSGYMEALLNGQASIETRDRLRTADAELNAKEEK